MEINLKWLDGYALILGKIVGYVVILIGISMTFLLLKTVLFE
jgi:hypothetical protein